MNSTGFFSTSKFSVPVIPSYVAFKVTFPDLTAFMLLTSSTTRLEFDGFIEKFTFSLF